MDYSDLDAALFFDPVPGAYAIYRAFADAVLAAYPKTQIKIQKTQITFYAPRVFASASLLRARRKAELPKPWLTVTLGLPCRLESPRAAICTEPYPGRWTTHIVLGGRDDLDEELLAWLERAYDFSERK